jgi:hypothetical protein
MSKGNWTDDHWVGVMRDYGAAGLWAKCSGGVLPQHLPVSDEIRARLVKRQAWFEE